MSNVNIDKRIFDYNWLLERALKSLPSKPVEHRKRFEIPTVKISIAGSETVILNFRQICNVLRREPKHLLRFILRELSVAGTIKEGKAIIHKPVSEAKLNQIIRRYTQLYVICPVCGSPDTILVKEKRIQLIKCEACGATSAVAVR